jgi:hypothetical protein
VYAARVVHRARHRGTTTACSRYSDIDFLSAPLCLCLKSYSAWPTVAHLQKEFRNQYLISIWNGKVNELEGSVWVGEEHTAPYGARCH